MDEERVYGRIVRTDYDYDTPHESSEGGSSSSSTDSSSSSGTDSSGTDSSSKTDSAGTDSSSSEDEVEVYYEHEYAIKEEPVLNENEIYYDHEFAKNETGCYYVGDKENEAGCYVAGNEIEAAYDDEYDDVGDDEVEEAYDTENDAVVDDEDEAAYNDEDDHVGDDEIEAGCDELMKYKGSATSTADHLMKDKDLVISSSPPKITSDDLMKDKDLVISSSPMKSTADDNHDDYAANDIAIQDDCPLGVEEENKGEVSEVELLKETDEAGVETVAGCDYKDAYPLVEEVYNNREDTEVELSKETDDAGVKTDAGCDDAPKTDPYFVEYTGEAKFKDKQHYVAGTHASGVPQKKAKVVGPNN